MKKINFKKKKAFTLIEALITVAITGVLISGLGYMLRDGYYMWTYGSARLALTGEARIIIGAIHKFVQNAQASTIIISRKDSNQPANSYIAGKLMETIYLKTSGETCGFFAGGANMIGTAGGNFEIYQKDRTLFAIVPSASQDAFLNPSESQITYKTITLTTNIENFYVAFSDTKSDKMMNVCIKLSKKIYNNKPPIYVMLKKNIVLRHYHTSGYYGN